jgi:hypothetical protein
MKLQHGGAFRVNGYLALLLLALAAGCAADAYYQHSHRTIEMHITLPTMQLQKADDEYVTHAFPDIRDVCDSFDTICWIRI